MGTDIHIAVEIRKPDGWHLIDVPVTENRNYRAFAVLANVRNGYGFAGSDTGDEVTPISEPRGLPDDMSPELRHKLEDDERAAPAFEDEDEQYFWLGDHSFSWVTLKEMLDYDLDAPVTVRGYVSEQAARDYREKGILPGSSAGWTSLPGFVKLEWQVPLRQSASLVGQLIEEIRDLGKPEDVRLVFGFDS
jgi:hypothetical protein